MSLCEKIAIIMKVTFAKYKIWPKKVTSNEFIEGKVEPIQSRGLHHSILLYNSFRFTRIHTLVLGKVSKPVFLFEINTLRRPNSLMAEHFAPHSLACEQALQVWRAKRTAVFFRVRLSGDYSRLPQMES